jgi:hypothetical protein
MLEMKLVIMAAALMLGGSAAAQVPCCTEGQTVAPDNSNPERDARGIPVVSAPATAPAGYNQPPHTMAPGEAAPPAGPAPTQGASGPLPPCSRTVTDRCTQTYERGRRPG